MQFRQNMKLNYLDVPLLIKFHLGKIFFEAGPQFGFLLSSKSRDEYLLNQKNNAVKVQSGYYSHSVIEPIDIGFVAGVGYQMNSGLGFNFRYNQGFREVVKRANWQKNVLIQTSITYTLGYRAYKERSTGNTSTDNFEEYFDLSKARRRQDGYKVLFKQNIQRISVVKVGEATRSEVQYVFNSIGSHTPSNVLLMGTSGFEEQTPLYKGFRDIQVPFKGGVRFSTKSSIGSGTIESNLELEISKPGIWMVTILTQ